MKPRRAQSDKNIDASCQRNEDAHEQTEFVRVQPAASDSDPPSELLSIHVNNQQNRLRSLILLPRCVKACYFELSGAIGCNDAIDSAHGQGLPEITVASMGTAASLSVEM